MSRVLWASAAIAIGITLTPGVALAADSRSHSSSRYSSTRTKDGTDANAVLAIGAGYALQQGSPAVRALQRQLVEQGISPGPVDGRYGPLTAAAVRRFQGARGLAVDGIVGPATRRSLAAGWLSEGAGFLQPRGSAAVRLVQARLKEAGFSPGPIDGRYGSLTQQAVERFQQAHGLSVDGMTGTQTQAALARSRNSPKVSRPKPFPRAHGRNRKHTAKPLAPRHRSHGHGNRTSGPAGRKSTAPRHGGHLSVLTVLVIIVLGALGIALVLAVRELRRRRELTSAPSVRESVREPEVAAATVAASVPVPAMQESESNGEPPEPPADPARLEQVKALQRQLGVLGFDPGPVDGRYGSRTTGAVKRLQKTTGLEPDGIVGPLTAEVLRRNAPAPPADDRAERVKALQSQLSWLGFEPGPVDGRYGPLTTGAVKRFQEVHDLPVDGIVGATTAEALRASIAQRPSSDRTDRVKSLQRQLQWLGFEPGAIDGRYGPQTTEAVRRFQDANDLPVNGIVDQTTQRALQDSVQRAGHW